MQTMDHRRLCNGLRSWILPPSATHPLAIPCERLLRDLPGGAPLHPEAEPFEREPNL